MTMRFYNTLGAELQEFQTIEPGKVRMYCCGPTVHDRPHIGNFRTFVFEDILHRYLMYKGYDVHLVMNITDVEDKTILKSRKQNLSLQEYTEKYTQAFFEDRDIMKILPAREYPRATGHIPEMIDMVQTLLDRNIAYKSRDSIYFRISSFPEYGKLAGIDRSSLIDGYRVDSDDYSKESPKDFVLWKGRKEDEDYWEAPFGEGRPGWHIECSVMSSKYLGTPIDIHAGGVDLIFPHHENEIAQSEAALGTTFVKYWLHSAHLTVEGEKMAKSKGNFFTIHDLVEEGIDPLVIRYMLLSVHYRKQLSFSDETLTQARGAVTRLKDFLYRLEQEAFPQGNSDEAAPITNRALRTFEDSLDDDLNVSGALGALFEMIYEVNRLADQKNLCSGDIPQILDAVRKMDQVFAIAVYPETRIDSEIEMWIEKRNEARRKKDFGTADEIRDALLQKGIALEDTPSGTRWKKV